MKLKRNNKTNTDKIGAGTDSEIPKRTGGKRDVGVENDNFFQRVGQSLGQRKLHESVNSRVMFVRDPGHLRLELVGRLEGSLEGRDAPSGE